MSDLSYSEQLNNAANEFNRINQKEELALRAVTQQIKTQAAIAKGKVLLTLQQQIPKGEFMNFLQRPDIDLPYTSANRYMVVAKQFEEVADLAGGEYASMFSSTALTNLGALPAKRKQELVEEFATRPESDAVPSAKEIKAVSDQTEIKLEKASEELEAAQAKRLNAEEQLAELKAQGGNSSSEGYQELHTEKASANRSIEKLENKLNQLQKQLDQEAVEKERISKEVEMLKFDEVAARQQRVNRVGNQLILTVPALMSDLQKYVSENEYYSNEVQTAVNGPITNLLSFLQQHFEYAQESSSAG